MTKGKWYGCKKWDNKHDFVKLNYVKDYQAYFTECIDSGIHEVKNDWWSYTNGILFEADMSIVSPLLPDGHPDKITAEETSFVLPEKWHIKVDSTNTPEIVHKWREIDWVGPGCITNTKMWYNNPPVSSAEISLEQFKQHVLKKSIVEIMNEEENYVGRSIKALRDNPQNTGLKTGDTVKIKLLKTDYILEGGWFISKPLIASDWELIPEKEEIKKTDMLSIQEEAKKRFPVGCKFIPVGDFNTYTLKKDSFTYSINSNQIWAHDSHGTLYNNGNWATLVSLPESEEKSIPEYVRCVRKLNSAAVGKIYKVINNAVCESDSLSVNYSWKTLDYVASTKEEYEVQNLIKYNPQIGDYVVMEKAGGWGYDPTNNGCIAIVEKISSIDVGYGSNTITVPSISGHIINPKIEDYVNFTDIPVIDHEKQPIIRKDLPHEIPKKLHEGVGIVEWSKGTYAVGLRGNFGVFTGLNHLITVGKIFKITKKTGDTIRVKDSEFWIYKKNLKWFATYDEAVQFSTQLKASPVPTVPSDSIVEEKINTPSIKKETFIEDVQSINVPLRTKRKSIKF